jgi:hypothetical protein
MSNQIRRENLRTENTRDGKLTTYNTCLPGDEHIQIPIQAGQHYVITASVGGPCDNRGWTWDNGANWVGPLGGAGLTVGDAMMPKRVFRSVGGIDQQHRWRFLHE